MEVDITGSPNDDYGSALNRIFADGLPDLLPSLPAYWQSYAQRALVEPSQRKADAAKEPHLPPQFGPQSHVHAPVPTDFPQPEFTQAARHLKYNAAVRVGFVVKDDGTTAKPYIVTAAGLGLDEQAIDAVLRYRFQPARRDDGTPVAVELMVDVNFQIY